MIPGMKIFTLILGLTLLVSCVPNETSSHSENINVAGNGTNDTTISKITFYKVNGKAILLGKSIKLLDESLAEIKDISSMNEQFVEIIEVSNNFHKAKPIDDQCQEFKYVKVKTKDFEGYVDGRSLYEPIKHIQNKIVKIENNKVSFIATTNFGIGVSDSDGLTGCPIHTPVIFSDDNAKYEGLVKMVKNKHYESDYPYLELKADDSMNDEILSIDKQDDKYLLKIKRTYQEGGKTLLVSVYQDKSKTYVAEILEINSM